MSRIIILGVLTLGILSGCAQTRAPLVAPSDLPAAFPTPAADSQTVGDIPKRWLDSLQAPYLSDIVDHALANNYQLAQQALEVRIASEQVKINRATRLPTLGISLSGQRFRPRASSAVITDQVDISANLDFELDIWGRLSDVQRQAELVFAAEKMDYLDAERRLVAQVVSTTFDVISAHQLQAVFSQRLDNLTQGLDVIEKGYRSGLNEALDVYLAQNTVQQERANVASQRQVSFEATTALELLLAEYPGAKYAVSYNLPELAPLTEVGVPATLLKRRPDIQAAWLGLLSADAALAIAHKNRFPSLNLSASSGDSASAFNRLLDGGATAFTVAASLFQPIFQGGRLKALSEQARLRVEQAEQQYLATVYAALAEVENELSEAVSLKERYDAFLQAEANADTALTLAFDQYQRGLVNFTTVLESQRRAFDAQTTVVQLRNLRLQSRIALLLALGGNF